MNNEKAFLTCYQLWRKFEIKFFYLEKNTLEYAIVYEIVNVENLLSELTKLSEANAKVTVLTKCFF